MRKFYREKVIVNKIKCNLCGDEIESKHGHDFRTCKCGAVSVDGGKNYLRRLGYRQDWTELSETVHEEREPYEWELQDESTNP